VSSTNALQAWAREASSMPFIWSNQNSPRPPRPYGRITVITDSASPWPSYSSVASDGTSEIINHWALTTSLQVFSETGSDPRSGIEKMLTLRQSLDRPSVRLNLFDQGWVFVRSVLGPQESPELLDSRFEPRAIMDIEWRVARKVIDDLGIVEQVKIQGNINDRNISIEGGSQ
jgi:hypothetical protein